MTEADQRRRQAVRATTLSVAADLRQWLEWQLDTGVDELPTEPVEPALRRPLRVSIPVSPRAAATPPGHQPSTPRAPLPPVRERPLQPPRPRTARPPTVPPYGQGPPGAVPHPFAPGAPHPADLPGGRGDGPPTEPSDGEWHPHLPPATPGHPGEGLAEIAAELGPCDRCSLAATRRTIVFGAGDPAARLMVIGEGPGRDEDRTGVPFVGRAGQLLTRMLAAIDVSRDAAYIGNVIKCRPPGNRDPLPHEIAACGPFLQRQVGTVGPLVILALGRFASQYLLSVEESMGRMRGRVGSFAGVPVVPTYHPAALLRNPQLKRLTWQDLLTVRELLRGGAPPA